jgi:hypothetical protein
MIIANPPVLPFAGFKWRWASVAPTEGLNDPPVLIGVLRAFRKFEGHAPRNPALLKELAKIQAETQSPVDLVRTSNRNLIRNSGQYWKALGLIDNSRGLIALTPFGRDVADGLITMPEFAASVVAAMELPNRMIQEDVGVWDAAGVRFKPLSLLLDILSRLRDRDPKQAFITKFELVRIVVPLSANHSHLDDFADTIVAWRQGHLNLSGWPNCAPKANDHRMASEFLIFLTHHGYCCKPVGADPWTAKYFLAIQDYFKIKQSKVVFDPNSLLQVAAQVTKTGVADLIERARVVREVAVAARPNQAKFRREVLAKSRGECVLTGTRLEAALEAAHIIPVQRGGGDTVGNGLCMRSDIHTLFDSGHLRIAPDGSLHLSKAASNDPIYGKLQAAIALPNYVETKNVEWRWSYA